MQRFGRSGVGCLNGWAESRVRGWLLCHQSFYGQAGIEGVQEGWQEKGQQAFSHFSYAASADVTGEYGV